MENKKSNKGLVIFLIILIILLGTGLGLLLSGVVKNPFIKEKTCQKCTKCDVKTTEDTKLDKKEEKETRYYQYKKEVPDLNKEGTVYKTYEIELNKDGTAKIDFLNVLDNNPKTGIYVEDDKYIILALNNDNDQCYEGNYNAIVSDGCTDTIILIKDKDVLKFQRGFIYHFAIDDINSTQEFLKVEKSELLTGLKN